MPENPFLADSTLPFGLPHFDRIADSDYKPAIEQGMAEHLAEVGAIASNPEVPTFANTLVPLERAGRLLARVMAVFNNLKDAHSNEAIRALERELSPRLAAHEDEVRLNRALFARIDALHARGPHLGLDPESLRVLELTHMEFVRNGALLSAGDKARLKELNKEMAVLVTACTQNIQEERNASSVPLADSDGLAGPGPGLELRQGGGWAVRLVNTTDQDILPSIANRDLRRRVMEASLARGVRGGAYDNRANLPRLARIRSEIARLLGHPDYASLRVLDQMAATPDAVLGLLRSLRGPALAKARAEAEAIQSSIDRTGRPFALEPWDWSYWSERVRKESHAFDESELRPFLEINRVLEDGLFHSANRLFGLTFRLRPDLPVYHPDVRVYEVLDADGTPLALMLADFFARPSKKGGAWMNSYVAQSRLLGQRAVVGNHLNVPKPPEGQPALLSLDQVTTLFHEFGHVLHGLLSNVHYPSLSGTNVPRDFVEFPSQLYEMWASWPEVAAHFARHHATGEPMPAALLQGMLDTRTFDTGFSTTEYLESALLDHAWNRLAPGEEPSDIASFEAAVLGRHGVAYAPIPPRYRSAYFTHSISEGYCARYYSYIWADTLVADAIEWFRDHGGLTRENGERLRHEVLSRGFAADPMAQYRSLTGRDPDVRALIRRRGLPEAGN
jgi:peptidyl-dipeptidase Dcp